jgi:hypothetical protein
MPGACGGQNRCGATPTADPRRAATGRATPASGTTRPGTAQATVAVADVVPAETAAPSAA